MGIPKGTNKTDAQRRSENKYQLARFSTLSCKVCKDDADAFRALAAAKGTTTNAMITEFVEQTLQQNAEQ